MRSRFVSLSIGGRSKILPGWSEVQQHPGTGAPSLPLLDLLSPQIDFAFNLFLGVAVTRLKDAASGFRLRLRIDDSIPQSWRRRLEFDVSSSRSVRRFSCQFRADP